MFISNEYFLKPGVWVNLMCRDGKLFTLDDCKLKTTLEAFERGLRASSIIFRFICASLICNFPMIFSYSNHFLVILFLYSAINTVLFLQTTGPVSAGATPLASSLPPPLPPLLFPNRTAQRTRPLRRSTPRRAGRRSRPTVGSPTRT